MIEDVFLNASLVVRSGEEGRHALHLVRLGRLRAPNVGLVEDRLGLHVPVSAVITVEVPYVIDAVALRMWRYSRCGAPAVYTVPLRSQQVQSMDQNWTTIPVTTVRHHHTGVSFESLSLGWTAVDILSK